MSTKINLILWFSEVVGWVLIVIPSISMDLRMFIWRLLAFLLPPALYILGMEELNLLRMREFLSSTMFSALGIEDNTVYSINE